MISPRELWRFGSAGEEVEVGAVGCDGAVVLLGAAAAG